MVIGKGKRAIEEHFDRSFQLEDSVPEGRTAELEAIRRISIWPTFILSGRRSRRARDAVLCGRQHMGNERSPFSWVIP